MTLLNCPWCGGQPIVHSVQAAEKINGAHKIAIREGYTEIACLRVNCVVKPSLRLWDAKEAVEVWNRRAL